jgi:hypothetical protein
MKGEILRKIIASRGGVGIIYQEGSNSKYNLLLENLFI